MLWYIDFKWFWEKNRDDGDTPQNIDGCFEHLHILNNIFIIQAFPWNIKLLKRLSEINSAFTNNVIRTNYSDESTDRYLHLNPAASWIFAARNSASQLPVKLSITATLPAQSHNSRGSRPQQVAASLTLKGS